MSQATKKTQAAAKLATNIADKAAKNSFAAVESTRNSAENVIKIGSTAMKDFIASSAGEAQKAQEKAFAIGRENAAQVAKSADAVTKALYEAVSVSRDNIEAAIEYSNVAAALAKDISAEAFEAANKAFADNVELSKDVFACRTINDMLELQNKVAKQSIDNFFNQSLKLSGMIFEYTNEALEPINERIAQTSEQISKAFNNA
ncbi:MAG: phasin family protein [Rickettsiales bacterium]|nr:phasin family protein [Rickettsiales bacterium]